MRINSTKGAWFIVCSRIAIGTNSMSTMKINIKFIIVTNATFAYIIKSSKERNFVFKNGVMIIMA